MHKRKVVCNPEILSPDTYVASQTKSGVTMRFVAYRSSSSGQIYLVICTTKSNGKSVDIHFKM